LGKDSYNDVGDLATKSHFNTQYTYTYESGKYGAFRNVVGNSQIVATFLEGTLFQAVCRRPHNGTLTSPFYTSTWVNIYDDEGYITGFTTTSGNGDESWGTISYNQ